MKIKGLITVFLVLFCLVTSSQTRMSINLFRITGTQSNLTTGCAAFYDPMWSDTVDLDDARLISNPFSETIGILRNRIMLAGEKRTTFDTIPLRIWSLRNSNYNIEIIPQNIQNAFFEVIDSAKLYPITDTFRYRFNNSIVCATDTNKNYRIIFIRGVLSLNENQTVVRQASHEHLIKIYPNPFVDHINIDMKNLALGKYNVYFYGEKSKSVLQINHKKDGVEFINVSRLLPGIYHLVIENDRRDKYISQIIKF